MNRFFFIHNDRIVLGAVQQMDCLQRLGTSQLDAAHTFRILLHLRYLLNRESQEDTAGCLDDRLSHAVRRLYREKHIILLKLGCRHCPVICLKFPARHDLDHRILRCK